MRRRWNDEDDHGDWLHECKRDKVLDEARCEICVNYRYRWNEDGSAICKLGKPLVPCRDFLREIGSEG